MTSMTGPSSILLFAAGLGTRMGPLTANQPKALVNVAGKPLIDHALALTEIPQIETRVVNVHYKADMLRGHLSDADIRISDETDLLRETGGGLRHARSLIDDGPTLTLNTDAVWRGVNPVDMILKAWSPQMEALLMLVPKSRAIGHRGAGDFVQNQQGRLTRGKGDIYTGLQIIRTDTLDEIKDEVFSMNVVWDKIAARDGLFGTVYSGEWCDVGQPESIPLAESLLGYGAHV